MKWQCSTYFYTYFCLLTKVSWAWKYDWLTGRNKSLSSTCSRCTCITCNEGARETMDPLGAYLPKDDISGAIKCHNIQKRTFQGVWVGEMSYSELVNVNFNNFVSFSKFIRQIVATKLCIKRRINEKPPPHPKNIIQIMKIFWHFTDLKTSLYALWRDFLFWKK